MPNQFFSPDGDLEEYFVTDYWLIDQYIGDQLWAWGNGTDGRLGNANTTDRSTPVTTFAGGTNWKQVIAAFRHNSAIKTDGTLWAWGNYAGGALGNADTSSIIRSTPVTTFAGGTNWKQVSNGYIHTTAIKTDGTLWIWGTASFGKLGNGVTTGNISTPITTFAGGSNWKQVSTGRSSTAAIKTDGTLWVWGYNNRGQLGNAQTIDVSTPVTTFSGGSNWKQVSGGYNHTAAIKTDGTLWTWGNGTNAQLGNAQKPFAISTPVTTFSGGTNWKQVSAGETHTAAIKTDGTLWTWGNGISGALGNAQTIDVSTPVTTFAGGTNWKQVSSSVYIDLTSAIKTDGTLWTWGFNFKGALGNGVTSGSISTPVTTFTGGTNWKQVSAGGEYTLAVQSGISAEYPLS